VCVVKQAAHPSFLLTLAQVLEVMLGAVSIRPGLGPAQRAANCTAVAMAALAGLGPLARHGRSSSGGGGGGSSSDAAGADKLAGKVLQLASCLLEEQVRWVGAADWAL
jgi:hypothetical protein